MSQEPASPRDAFAPVRIDMPPVVKTYIPVTLAEIEAYSQFGWLATIMLTFFGTASGTAFGSWVALQQGGLPPAGSATLSAVAWSAGVFAAVSLVFALLLIVLQARQKKAWVPKPPPAG